MGIKEISCWRSAFAMTIIAASPLTCILPHGVSSLFILYSLGYIFSILVSAIFLTPVLHNIPSPSVCQYYQRRFHSSFLHHCVVIINIIIASLLAVFLLVFSASLTAYLSSYSVLIMCPLLGYLSIFSIIFAGQTSVSSPTCIASFLLIVLGVSLILYNGIEELTGLHYQFIRQHDFLALPSITLFFVGFITGLHLTTSSPIFYQQYFALCDRQQLRWAFLIHLLLFALFAFCLSCISLLFEQFASVTRISSNTAISMVQFLKAAVPQSSIFSIFANSALVLITLWSFTFIILSLSTTIWEDILRSYMNRWSQVRQLCILQVALFTSGTFVICSSISVLHFIKDYLGYFPHTFVLLSSLASPLTAISLCAFLYPCINGKGAFVGIFTGFLFLVSMAVIRLNHLWLYAPNLHDNATLSLNDYTTVEPLSAMNASLFFSEISEDLIADRINVISTETSDLSATGSPYYSGFIHANCEPSVLLPLFAFMVAIASAIATSICTKNENAVAVDPDLMVNSLFTKAFLSQRFPETGIRKAFDEAESLRYAQQTAEPIAVYSEANPSLARKLQ